MKKTALECFCLVGIFACICFMVGIISGGDYHLINGLVADGVVTPPRSSGPTQTVEEYRRQPPKRGRAQITYGGDLPASVTTETIRRDRDDPRIGCPECMQWTMTKRRGEDGHYVPDQIFNNEREIPLPTMRDFSKVWPTGGGYGR